AHRRLTTAAGDDQRDRHREEASREGDEDREYGAAAGDDLEDRGDERKPVKHERHHVWQAQIGPVQRTELAYAQRGVTEAGRSAEPVQVFVGPAVTHEGRERLRGLRPETEDRRGDR